MRGPGAVRLGPVPPDYTSEKWLTGYGQRDACEVLLADVLGRVGQKMIYTYDMGDNWEHLILGEAIEEVPAAEASARPQCLTGRRACPPEDCGGMYGYYDILNLPATQKRRPAHLKGYDPAAFDRAAVNAALAGSRG